jgi:hypothetical protein
MPSASLGRDAWKTEPFALSAISAVNESYELAHRLGGRDGIMLPDVTGTDGPFGRALLSTPCLTPGSLVAVWNIET